MTTTVKTECHGCGEMLPLDALKAWPATNELRCKVCLPARVEGDDERERVWAQFDVLQALDTLGLAEVLELQRVWCRSQCGEGWTEREQTLAAIAVMLGEAALMVGRLG